MYTLYMIVLLFKQKPAYEVRISDWSSDVCSSDLVDQQRPIKLPPDVAALLDIDPRHLAARRPRLLRHQDPAQHRCRRRPDRLQRLHHPDAATATRIVPEPHRTTPARTNLRLHDPHRTDKLPVHRLRLLRRVSPHATRHRNPIAPPQSLRLAPMGSHTVSLHT